MHTKTCYIQGYYGYGDSLYMYPFVKELSKQYKEIYLRTPFPQLFSTLPNIKFIKPPSTHLSTCKEYMELYETRYKTLKEINPDESLVFNYQRAHKKRIGMVEAFNNAVPSLTDSPINWSIPLKPEWVKEAGDLLNSIHTNRKICLIKLPSTRKEWFNIARVGKPEYFQYVINKLKEDYFFISVGNKKIETYLDKCFGIDLELNNAELSINGILALTAMSDLVVGYHSFLIAAGIATGIKTFCIFGGYIRPELWIDREKMNMNKIGYVAPEPFCNCFNRHHKDCNKEIPLIEIDKELNRLLNEEEKIDTPVEIVIPKIQKQNLLISRIRAERCNVLANNNWIKNRFNIYTVDHTSVGAYKEYGNEFENSYVFPHNSQHLMNTYTDEQIENIYQFSKKILQDNNINLVINSHPLHTYNTQMHRACKELNINCINTEMFCDDKMIFDWKGCQYTKENEIYDYVSKIQKITDRTVIDYPKKTRQPQPDTISGEEFFKKYNLKPGKNYIVMLGQLMWDMSVIQSVNKETADYKGYINLILSSNPDTTFIVKPHPLDLKRGNSEFINIVKSYPNVVIVNESLDTLFNIFDYFTSFSSTTILEGLIRNKKFATMGFHFCNNDGLIYQIRVNFKAKNLLERLKNLQINKDLLQKYIYFVCNYYTMKGSSDKVFYRLTMTPEEYFSQKL